MKLEHVALNVSDPHAIADWYVHNLGMSIAKKVTTAPFITFIADDSGTMLIELYNESAHPVPNYAEMDPLILHVAFASADPNDDKERLVAAGATFHSERNLPDGTLLVMLRDPWGLALQLAKRPTPMLVP